jgi:aerobic carbon-monoxide dehydrogenase medium subunit
MTALQSPKTIVELTRLAAKAGKRAFFISGIDASSVPAARMAIDVSGVPQINEVDLSKDKVVIGTGLTFGRVVRDVDGENGLLRQAASLIANPLVRNRVTLIQALDPDSLYFDITTPLVLLETKVRLQNPTGKRLMSIQDYLDAASKGLKKGEIPVQLEFPRIPRELRAGFFRVVRTSGKGSVSAAARMRLMRNVCKEPELVVSSLSLVPLRTATAEKELEGHAANEDIIQRAASAAATEILDLADSKNTLERSFIEIAVARTLRSIMEGSMPA